MTTRIDMTASDLHKLLKPVLPHASTDPDMPELAVVRLELTEPAVYAIAYDRYTLAAERYALFGKERPALDGAPTQPVHVNAREAAAALKVFTYSKDYDPILKIIVDSVPVPVTIVGQPRSVNRLAVTIHGEDGTRLALQDVRDPARDPLAKWRQQISAAMTRPSGHPIEGLDLRPGQFGRWGHAARKGERLTFYAGPELGDPLLITVEDHFAGLWAVPTYLDAPAKTLSELAWYSELTTGTGQPRIDLATGERLDGGQ